MQRADPASSTRGVRAVSAFYSTTRPYGAARGGRIPKPGFPPQRIERSSAQPAGYTPDSWERRQDARRACPWSAGG